MSIIIPFFRLAFIVIRTCFTYDNEPFNNPYLVAKTFCNVCQNIVYKGLSFFFKKNWPEKIKGWGLVHV